MKEGERVCMYVNRATRSESNCQQQLAADNNNNNRFIKKNLLEASGQPVRFQLRTRNHIKTSKTKSVHSFTFITLKQQYCGRSVSKSSVLLVLYIYLKSKKRKERKKNTKHSQLLSSFNGLFHKTKK